jgi:hypothetical protein
MADGSAIYLIDTCAIGDLEGISPKTSYTPDPTVRERIWKGLEKLIVDGRLRTVYAVKDEIKRKCPPAYLRLEPLAKDFYLQDTVVLFAEVTQVLIVSPDWTKKLNSAKPNRDMADPYIVALAQLDGYAIVTNELHKDKRKNKKGDRIPDVCERLKMNSPLSLADFVGIEKL